jgi:hypothetical protein
MKYLILALLLLPISVQADPSTHYYRIPINHNDAYIIAELIAQESKVVLVPSNDVLPSQPITQRTYTTPSYGMSSGTLAPPPTVDLLPLTSG